MGVGKDRIIISHSDKDDETLSVAENCLFVITLSKILSNSGSSFNG